MHPNMFSLSRRSILSLLLLAFALIFTACQATPTQESQPGEAEVTGETALPTTTAGTEPIQQDQAPLVQIDIIGFSFDPGEITISAGTTVTWQHDSNAPHTVTADSGLFRSPTLNNGDEFSFTFEEPGTYAYYCEFHGGPDGSGMSGLITVTD